MSEAKRGTANEWFRTTLMSRLDDKRTGAIAIVMQRVHVDDLMGFVLSLSDEWTVLNLPAIAEIDEREPRSRRSCSDRFRGSSRSNLNGTR